MIINVFISDDMVKKEKRKRTLDYAWTLIVNSILEVFQLPIKLYYIYNYKEANDSKNFLNKNAVTFGALYALMILWMSERLINLVRNQNVKILAPAIPIFTAHAILAFVKQSIESNHFNLGNIYKNIIVTEYPSIHWIGPTNFIFYLAQYILLLPFLIFNRFYIIVFYFFLVIFSSIYAQITYDSLSLSNECVDHFDKINSPP